MELIADTPSARLSASLLFCQSRERWLDLLNQALDLTSEEYARTPKERQGRSEDAISIDVVHSLKMLGFRAGHDLTVGGHCDVVVENKYGDLWLGEAKVHKSFNWLLSGFEQLDKRYSLASASQDQGALLIYCFGERVDRVIKRWRETLVSNRPDINIVLDEKKPLEFVSIHKHRRNGQDYHVRHLPISLYWDPDSKNPMPDGCGDDYP